MKKNFLRLTFVMVSVSVASCASVVHKSVEKEHVKDYASMNVNVLTPNEKIIAISEVDNGENKPNEYKNIKENIIKTFNTQDKLYLSFMMGVQPQTEYHGSIAKIIYDIKKSGLFDNVFNITCSKDGNMCIYSQQNPQKRFFFTDDFHFPNYISLEAKNGNSLACKMLYYGRNKYSYNDSNGLYYQAINSCEKLNIPGYSFYNALNRLKHEEYEHYFDSVLWPKFLHNEVRSAINVCKSVNLPSKINYQTLRDVVYPFISSGIYRCPYKSATECQLFKNNEKSEIYSEMYHITHQNLQISPHTTPIVAKRLCKYYGKMYIK